MRSNRYVVALAGVIFHLMIASIIIWFLGYYPNHDAYETVAEQQDRVPRRDLVGDYRNFDYRLNL